MKERPILFSAPMVRAIRSGAKTQISTWDAQSEGVNPFDYGDVCRDDETKHQACFRVLWESINGPGSWEANPWVWVVGFHRIAQMARAA